MQPMAEVAEEFIANEIGVNRPKDDIVKNPVAVHKNYPAHDEYSQHRADDMPTQLFQMIHKGHLGFWFLLFFAKG